MAFTDRFEEGARGYLEEGETVELAVRGSVPPTLMVMSAITFVGLFAAFSLSTGIDSLRIRLVIVVGAMAVIVTMFTVYANAFFRSPVGPYVVAGLTEGRVLVFSRDMLGRLKGEPLIASRSDLTASLKRRSFLMPHQVTLTGFSDEPLLLDVPRIEPSPNFVAALDA